MKRSVQRFYGSRLGTNCVFQVTLKKHTLNSTRPEALTHIYWGLTLYAVPKKVLLSHDENIVLGKCREDLPQGTGGERGC